MKGKELKYKAHLIKGLNKQERKQSFAEDSDWSLNFKAALEKPNRNGSHFWETFIHQNTFFKSEYNSLSLVLKYDHEGYN